MANSRSNTVLVGLIAAVVAPRIEKATGIKLDTDDVAALVGLALVGWHGGIAGLAWLGTVFTHYFPPKVPFDTAVKPLFTPRVSTSQPLAPEKA